MIICTGRGTHDAAEISLVSHFYDGSLPGTTTAWPPLLGGRQPAHMRASCPECGLTKLLGRRMEVRLGEAEDALPAGAAVGEVWGSIPGLLGHPLDDDAHFLPPLRFESHALQGVFGERPEIRGRVHGLPLRLADAADRGQAVTEFLSQYPALAASGEGILLPSGLAPDPWEAGAVMAMRCWPWPHEVDRTSEEQVLRDFGDSRSMPYLGDDDRWVFPRLGGAGIPLHPLLAWWALLFALSMLARYCPASWTGHLDVDTRSTAVKLGSALSLAMDTCPQLILHAIRAVCGSD